MGTFVMVGWVNIDIHKRRKQPMEEIDFGSELDMEQYEEELLDYIREVTSGDEEITDLLDEDIQYLLTLWDEYLESSGIDELGEDEDIEIDSDEFYRYVTEAIEQDEQDVDISLDGLIKLVNAEEAFVSQLLDEVDGEE